MCAPNNTPWFDICTTKDIFKKPAQHLASFTRLNRSLKKLQNKVQLQNIASIAKQLQNTAANAKQLQNIASTAKQLQNIAANAKQLQNNCCNCKTIAKHCCNCKSCLIVLLLTVSSSEIRSWIGTVWNYIQSRLAFICCAIIIRCNMHLKAQYKLWNV